MVTVKSPVSGRVFEVRTIEHGTAGRSHHLFYGGICVASAGGISSGSSGVSFARALEKADEAADSIGLSLKDPQD